MESMRHPVCCHRADIAVIGGGLAGMLPVTA